MINDMVFQSRGECWYLVPVEELEDFRHTSDDHIDLLYDKYRCAPPNNYRIQLVGDV